MSKRKITSWLTMITLDDFHPMNGSIRCSLMNFNRLAPFIADYRSTTQEEIDADEKFAEVRKARVSKFASRLSSIIDENLFQLLLALADKSLRQVDVAKMLEKKRYEVSREVKRVHDEIRDRLGYA